MKRQFVGTLVVAQAVLVLLSGCAGAAGDAGDGSPTVVEEPAPAWTEVVIGQSALGCDVLSRTGEEDWLVLTDWKCSYTRLFDSFCAVELTSAEFDVGEHLVAEDGTLIDRYYSAAAGADLSALTDADGGVTILCPDSTSAYFSTRDFALVTLLPTAESAGVLDDHLSVAAEAAEPPRETESPVTAPSVPCEGFTTATAEIAAVCLYQAWVAGDVEAMGVFAGPEALEWLGSVAPGGDPAWSWQDCGPATFEADGVACAWLVDDGSGFSGVLVEMVLEYLESGWRVARIDTIG